MVNAFTTKPNHNRNPNHNHKTTDNINKNSIGNPIESGSYQNKNILQSHVTYHVTDFSFRLYLYWIIKHRDFFVCNRFSIEKYFN